MQDVLTKLQAVQAELDPQFKALKNVMGGLQRAIRLASAEKADALPMNKALNKLETAASQVPNESLQTAVAAFSAATQSALDGLAYDFAKDLRDTFSARGLSVEGRPPTLTVGLLTLKIDIAARKGQWLYGREALTNPIPLSLAAIVKAYDQQTKRIANRSIDGSALLQEIYKAWSDLIAEKARRPAGGRLNLIEVYAKLVLNRQSTRFWNAPTRNTFKDYERELFVRDLVLLQENGHTQLTADGETRQLRLGVATKAQADQASRSLWLPNTNEYYSDITFD